MSETIVLERRDLVASITIDRPPLNILNLVTLRELRRCLAELMVDGELQVVIVKGGGERAFSAGVAVEDHTPDKVESMLQEFHGAISILRDMPAISLAVVRGHCLGGGMELAVGCDLTFASDDSRFGQPEIELGCYPPLAAALYPSLVGSKRAFDLLLSGRIMGCSEAVDMGFVNRSAPADELDSLVEDVVGKLTSHSAAVTRLTKRAIRAGQTRDFSAALVEAEQIYINELTATEDMQEGLAAFLEKRPPDWKHR